MPEPKERLTILSEAEWSVLYDLPNFNEEQRAEFFLFSKAELYLVYGRSTIQAQLYCALQIGYFRAKQFFFSCPWEQIPEKDKSYVLEKYFTDFIFIQQPLSKHEHYVQQSIISEFFRHRFWSKKLIPEVHHYAVQITKRDAAPQFVAIELIAYLKKQNIIYPSYRILQDMVTKALAVERNRLTLIISQNLNTHEQASLRKLLEREESISDLAALKQDAKNFTFCMMKKERGKLLILDQLYLIAQRVLPQLAISKQNLRYYDSLIHYYTIYDLRRLQPEQTCLYLLCYVFQRYQQLNDNLVYAFKFHTRKLSEETKEKAQQKHTKQQAAEKRKFHLAGQLLLLYVVEDLFDNKAVFGDVREHAFSVLSKEEIRLIAESMMGQASTELALRWEITDQLFPRIRKRLRHLCLALKFSATTPTSPWHQAICLMQKVLSSKKSLSQQPLDEWPIETIPKRLRPYLLDLDTDGKATGLQTNRYEFWLYHQTRKRLLSGELFVKDSTKHRAFEEELVSLDNPEIALLDIFWLKHPIEKHLDTLLNDLDTAWTLFNDDLSQGRLKHLDYNAEKKTLHWRKSKVESAEEEAEKQQQSFYDKLPFVDIANILRFANEKTHVLSAFTSLQPRYAKQVAHEDSLLACILAQGMGHGNWSMAEMSDIPYHILESTQQQYLRLSTLRTANDLLSNAIANLSIFPHYSFDSEILYGAVDGQKFEVETPNIKARHSRKYLRQGTGVSAYTLLVNHVPIQTQLIGAHEHESYFLFDIWYKNTSDITPVIVTGDMHIVNKMNFIIMHCFGAASQPRFTNMETQLKHLYCRGPIEAYQQNIIQPVGTINCPLIIGEEQNINRIIMTLGLVSSSNCRVNN